MKVSIITVVRNAEKTVKDAILSVKHQTYPDIEHIIIDGASTDGTLDIIKQYSNDIAQLVCEPDKGIYDAMNKGIKLASGDVIGILNADDVYSSNQVIAQVVEHHQAEGVDAVYADLLYVHANDLGKVVRYWKSRSFKPGLCFKGWMPAHPTLFLKRHVYDKVGFFDISLRYQSDLEFCARLFEQCKVTSTYVPEVWVKMRMGGVTNNSISNIIKGNWESYKALRKLGLKRDPVSFFLLKFAPRLVQYFRPYHV